MAFSFDVHDVGLPQADPDDPEGTVMPSVFRYRRKGRIADLRRSSPACNVVMQVWRSPSADPVVQLLVMPDSKTGLRSTKLAHIKAALDKKEKALRVTLRTVCKVTLSCIVQLLTCRHLGERGLRKWYC